MARIQIKQIGAPPGTLDGARLIWDAVRDAWKVTSPTLTPEEFLDWRQNRLDPCKRVTDDYQGRSRT